MRSHLTTSPPKWHRGNAEEDGARTRGWFIGHFLDQNNGIRASSDLEIKWVNPRSGERRAQPATNETRTTILILINGKCRLALNTRSIILQEPGDYAIWGPGTDHTWEVIDDATLLTVRWPSTPQPHKDNHS